MKMEFDAKTAFFMEQVSSEPHELSSGCDYGLHLATGPREGHWNCPRNQPGHRCVERLEHQMGGDRGRVPASAATGQLKFRQKHPM